MCVCGGVMIAHPFCWNSFFVVLVAVVVVVHRTQPKTRLQTAEIHGYIWNVCIYVVMYIYSSRSMFVVRHNNDFNVWPSSTVVVTFDGLDYPVAILYYTILFFSMRDYIHFTCLCLGKYHFNLGCIMTIDVNENWMLLGKYEYEYIYICLGNVTVLMTDGDVARIFLYWTIEFSPKKTCFFFRKIELI